jgi:hypothetical protein
MTNFHSKQEAEFLTGSVFLTVEIELPFNEAGEVTRWLSERGYRVAQAHIKDKPSPDFEP